MAPLLANVRGQFAEFLNNASLVHLGTFIPVHLCRFAVRSPIFFSLPEGKHARSFSWKINTTDRLPEGYLCIVAHFHFTKRRIFLRIYLKKLIYYLHPKPMRGLLSQFSISFTNISSTGILTCYPSITPFGLILGPTNPWLTAIAMETLDIR
jgi:hypothetical protein